MRAAQLGHALREALDRVAPAEGQLPTAGLPLERRVEARLHLAPEEEELHALEPAHGADQIAYPLHLAAVAEAEDP